MFKISIVDLRRKVKEYNCETVCGVLEVLDKVDCGMVGTIVIERKDASKVPDSPFPPYFRNKISGRQLPPSHTKEPSCICHATKLPSGAEAVADNPQGTNELGMHVTALCK